MVKIMTKLSDFKAFKLPKVGFVLFGLLIFMSPSSILNAAEKTYTDVLNVSTDTGLMSLSQFNLNGTLTEADLSFWGTYTYDATNYTSDSVYASSALMISIISDGNKIKEIKKSTLVPIGPESTVTGQTISLTNSFKFTDEPTLNLLTGTGSIYLVLMAGTNLWSIDFSTLTIEELQDSEYNVTKQLTGGASIKYIYSAVPLPSSIVLLFFGIAGVLGYRKFKLNRKMV
jgi:hypothetical protein